MADAGWLSQQQEQVAPRTAEQAWAGGAGTAQLVKVAAEAAAAAAEVPGHQRIPQLQPAQIKINDLPAATAANNT